MDPINGNTRLQFVVGVIIAVVTVVVVMFIATVLLGKRRERGDPDTYCLTNLGGISKSLAMYMAENQGLVPYAPANVFKALEPYGAVGRIRVCPKAKSTAVSYGFNGWLYGAATSGTTPAPVGGQPFMFPVSQDNSLIPAFADAREIDGWPLETDAKPTKAEYDGKALTATGGHMKRFAIPRHGNAVNVGFLDHAENVKLPALWKLKWHAAWAPSPTAPTTIP